MKFKARLIAGIICFSLLTSVAQANVKVGTVYFYPPYVMSVNQGFDIDFIRLIFKRLNIDFQFIPMNYNQLFTALDTGEIDIAISGLSISIERQKKYIFSLPYMLSRGQFLILKDSPIKTMNDLIGQNVGVIKGTESGGVFFSFLFSKFNNIFKIIQYDDIEDVISALANGDISAVFTYKHSADYWVQNGGNKFVEIGPERIIGDGIGVMALPSQAPLIEQINQQLKVIEKDGSYLKLYSTYFSLSGD